jgi:hypothetical protein
MESEAYCALGGMDPLHQTQPKTPVPTVEPAIWLASRQSPFQATPPEMTSWQSSFQATQFPVPTSPASKQKVRIKLTPKDHLMLLNLVCEHIAEYSEGKLKFWAMISSLFEDASGKSIVLLTLITIITNKIKGK